MKRARCLRHFSEFGLSSPSTTLVRRISITAGVTLTITSLVLSPMATAFGKRPIPTTKSQAQQNNGQERRRAPLPPRFGPPAANLPNLEELRSAAESTRSNPSRIAAPAPIPSTLRSRKKSNDLPPGIRVVPAPGVTGKRSHHAKSRTSKAPSVAPEPSPVVPQSGRTNFALATNGSVATASSTYNLCCGFTPAAAIDGEHKGLNWMSGGGWHSGTSALPQWVQIDFNATRTIDEVDVYTKQDDYTNPIEPTEATTFSLYGLTAFDAQYWNGAAWVTVPGGSVSGNNKVWKKITFSAISTTKIRVLTNGSVDGWSRIPEIEAWGSATSTRTNVARAINGSVATASSTYTLCCGFTPAAVIDGEHKGLNWMSGGGWHSGTSALPQWVQIDFNATRTIDEVDVYTKQDDYTNPIEPTEATTFSLYGLTAFDVQYWTGAAWETVPGGSVSGNNKVWKKITFPAISTTKIRVLTNGSVDGWSRIPEIEAWSAVSGGGGGSPSDFAMARLNPRNRTGTGGEDLLSNNFNLNLPLVDLSGRELDLGLTLSYNSLVWTQAGNSINFDLDQGSIAPGFRLGFPTVEGPYFNSQANANFYLLITPSGGRIELRQVGTSIVYESKDSSHIQLTDNTGQDFSLLLQTTDGSKLRFETAGGGWRCKKITDRNGNFISATYKSWGELETVTDTLGRIMKFVYDGNDNLSCITQGWNGQAAPTTCEPSQPHTWATFGWGTAAIGNNFPGLNNRGPNSTTIAVLTQVGLPDGSRFNFEYNSYGMVSTIRHYAEDNHQRRYTTYVAPASATDCPRLTERRDWAEFWNGSNGVPAEVATSFGHDSDNGCRMTLPDGTVLKEYYGSSWQGGLTTETRSYATVADANSNLWQKKTTTSWTQDNPNAAYLTNPRVTETNVHDASGNHRRTTIDYGASSLGYVQWGLPHVVREYGVNGTTATEFRRSQADYHLAQPYLDRRIIGLVSSSQLYDAVANQWQAKVTYGYDDPAKLTSQATSATQHDSAYSQSFTARGNVTAVSRWDVTDINNASKALTSTMSYNAAGSPLSATDPAGHPNSLKYDDSFSDGINSRNTYAYPTTVTDADGFSSTAQYNFDFGAKTRVEGPPPQNQPNGIIQTFLYDDAARLQRVTTLNTGAYTRYVFGPFWTQSFSTVNTVADETYAITTFDGVGRAFTTATNHPGSAGGYKLVNIIFDRMGRPFRQSNPTEVNVSWLPDGDDAAGVRYSLLEFDWQGRTIRKTHPDGYQTDASYSGCGCAGGEVVTLTDEVGRRQKVYSDVLGRQGKTEVLNWDGSVYSATTNTFNARDQVTSVRQWAGAENGGGAYQDTTLGYDGYGRLKTKHSPEQQPDLNNGASTDHTTWNYNPDDSLQSVIDARGASVTYTYNARQLVTHIGYSAPTVNSPGSPIPVPPAVDFDYDAAGNRLWMNEDGQRRVTYHYNNLSQIDWEERQFPGVAAAYRLSYEYSLAGAVKKVTDETAGTNFATSFDSTGRVSAVNTVGYNGSTEQFASQIQYRAFGGLETMAYGNSTSVSIGYNVRGQVSNYSMSGVLNQASVPPSPVQISASYQYHADGRVKFVQDQASSNSLKDRAYKYDQVGRLAEGLSGTEARNFVNGSSGGPTDGPYRHGYTYDAWDNTITQGGRYWSRNATSTTNYNQFNRNPDWSYDAEGNLISRNQLPNAEEPRHSYDAAGRDTKVEYTQVCEIQPQNLLQTNIYTRTKKYDGDGQLVGYVQTRTVNGTMAAGWPVTGFYLRATVLGGQVISSYDGQGGWKDTQVYIGAERIGSLGKTEDGSNFYNTFRYADPLTGDEVTTMKSNVFSSFTGQSTLDTNGVGVPLADPFPPPEEDGDGTCVIWDDTYEGSYNGHGNGVGAVIPIEGSAGCVLDGLPMNCRFISSESSVQCPNNDCGTHAVTVTARARDGSIAGSSTFLTSYGQPGWSGSLDGTYGVGPDFTTDFNFNNASDGRRFLEEPELPYMRLRGGIGASTLAAPQEGHLGPRPKRGAPYVDRQVLNSCTWDYFGVTLNSFDESRSDHNGSFKGRGRSALPSIPNGPDGTATFTINNIMHNSNAYLTRKNNSLELPGEPKSGPIRGLTIRSIPRRNYTGYDNSPMQILMTQVHELGHSLDSITGRGYDISERHNGKTDLAGWKLENCVRKRNGFKWR